MEGLCLNANGRMMMKCAECGITKTKFVKQNQGNGLARRKGRAY